MKPTYANTVEALNKLYEIYGEEPWFVGVCLEFEDEEYAVSLYGKPLPEDLNHPFIFTKEIEGEEVEIWVYPEEKE